MPRRPGPAVFLICFAGLAACSTDYGVQPNPFRATAFSTQEGALGNADYGPATFIQSPNYVNSSRSPAGGQVKVIVVHTVQGSYNGCISWFQNPTAKVSAHYVVSKGGDVTQMVKEEDIGWHVGSENGYTIGIEHEGFVSDPTYVTPQMLDASAKLTCYLVKKWKLQASKVSIKGHVELPNQTHTDPGQFWPWNNYIAKVAACVNGGGTQPPPACPASCDDKNACTIDLCEAGKCVHSNANGIVCWDQDACTAGEKCQNGACVGGSQVKDCNDNNACTNDGCANSNCTHANNSAACDDGNGCTAGDACAGGSCKGGAAKNCNDGNPCTVDSCAAGSCKNVGATNCDDGKPCTDDSCQGGACAHVANAKACDDGNACTSGDKCAAGGCKSGVPKLCDDANPCTQDACSFGACVSVPLQGKCDDGDACTQEDGCVAGACAGVALDCDDDVACTTDSCKGGKCQHVGATGPVATTCQGNSVVQTDPCGGAGTKLVETCAAGSVCIDGACAPDPEGTGGEADAAGAGAGRGGDPSSSGDATTQPDAGARGGPIDTVAGKGPPDAAGGAGPDSRSPTTDAKTAGVNGVGDAGPLGVGAATPPLPAPGCTAGPRANASTSVLVSLLLAALLWLARGRRREPVRVFPHP
ncbi:MAG: N-acetylmuramoyl-L-alanine amidase [Myxococcales bacterium]|nr:N-acetylmuramoyl-L-alanine amidase [Myxococcales bacterium]